MVYLVGYIYVKYLVVGNSLTEYGVDAEYFLVLDICTVPTYTWGTGAVVRYLIKREIVFKTYVWGLTALTSFLMPYFYIAFSGGREFPLSVWLILIAAVSLMLAGAVYQVYSKVKKSRM